MPIEPGAHLGMLVGGVVVEDDVDRLVRGHRLDLVQGADELLMAVALHVAGDHGGFEDVKRGKQRRGGVALVVGAGPFSRG